MHNGILLAANASVPVLMMFLGIVRVVPEANSGPLAVDTNFQNDRVADGDLLRSAVTNAHIRIDVDEDFARPFGRGRSSPSLELSLGPREGPVVCGP